MKTLFQKIEGARTILVAGMGTSPAERVSIVGDDFLADILGYP